MYLKRPTGITNCAISLMNEALKAVEKNCFNVSRSSGRATLLDGITSASELGVRRLPADGIKCERCWNYRTDTDSYGPWPVVCGRCRNALDEMGYSELNASVAR